MDKTRVTFAYPYTDEAGKDHKTGETAALGWAEARTVLNHGIAREADAEDEQPTEKKGK